MPLNRPIPDAGVDAGTLTHYGITAAQLATVVAWVSGGAPMN
jgi:hypothetical protein